MLRTSETYRFFTAVGLVIAALVVGILIGRVRSDLPPGWPSVPLHASATAVSENLAIATGLLGDDVEGLFVLDGLSGDLQCTVFNPRIRQFNSLFRRNVIVDMRLDATKKPEFLMVTGELGTLRLIAEYMGQCIVYVVEVNTGTFVAYGVPWQRSAFNAGRAQMGELVVLYVGNVRTAAVRE